MDILHHSTVRGIEFILTNVKYFIRDHKVIDILKFKGDFMGNKFDINICLSFISIVSKVNEMPFSQLIFIRECLPKVGITFSIEFSVSVGSELKCTTDHFTSNEKSQISISHSCVL